MGKNYADSAATLQSRIEPPDHRQVCALHSFSLELSRRSRRAPRVDGYREHVLVLGSSIFVRFEQLVGCAAAPPIQCAVWRGVHESQHVRAVRQLCDI
ncbi:unnamed protein product [Sphagnum balticum]